MAVAGLLGLVACVDQASTPAPRAGAPPERAVLWRASHEGSSPSTQWRSEGGGGLVSSGAFEVALSTSARSGSGSLRARIWTPGTSGVRAFRWKEPRENRELFFSAWVLVEPGTTVTGQYWNLFQFKSRSTSGRNDPVWALYAVDDGGEIVLRLGWGWGGVPLAGPHSTDGIGGRWFDAGVDATLPTGRWVHLQGFLRQSKDFDGRVRFWRDGVELFDLQDVRTSFPNCSYNAWCASNEWSVNLYADALSPSPATMHIDDAAISRRFVSE